MFPLVNRIGLQFLSENVPTGRDNALTGIQKVSTVRENSQEMHWHLYSFFLQTIGSNLHPVRFYCQTGGRENATTGITSMSF